MPDEKIELSKTDVDNINLRKNNIQQKNMDLVIAQRELTFFGQELLKRYDKNNDWMIDGNFLVKTVKKGGNKSGDAKGRSGGDAPKVPNTGN